MRSEATSRARAEGIARTRHDLVQRLKCKPDVRHAAPARSTNSLSTTGKPPPRKCTPAVNCGMFTLLVVQQWCDRRDVGRRFGRKLMAIRSVRASQARRARKQRSDTRMARPPQQQGTTDRTKPHGRANRLADIGFRLLAVRMMLRCLPARKK